MENVSMYITKLKQKIYEIYNRTLSQFISAIFTSHASIIFLGIDNAGKTTLLNLLHDRSTQATFPTNHPTSIEIEIGNMTAVVFDLGGHKPARMVWKDYFHKCDGVVFIIDASDQNVERIEEAKEAYSSVCSSMLNTDKLGVPVCVLVNKMDKVYTKITKGDYTATESYIRNLLGRIGIEESDTVKTTCVTMLRDNETQKHDQNIYEAFAWFEGAITRAKKAGSDKGL